MQQKHESDFGNRVAFRPRSLLAAQKPGAHLSSRRKSPGAHDGPPHGRRRPPGGGALRPALRPVRGRDGALLEQHGRALRALVAPLDPARAAAQLHDVHGVGGPGRRVRGRADGGEERARPARGVRARRRQAPVPARLERRLLRVRRRQVGVPGRLLLEQAARAAELAGDGARLRARLRPLGVAAPADARRRRRARVGRVAVPRRRRLVGARRRRRRRGADPRVRARDHARAREHGAAVEPERRRVGAVGGARGRARERPTPRRRQRRQQPARGVRARRGQGALAEAPAGERDGRRRRPPDGRALGPLGVPRRRLRLRRLDRHHRRPAPPGLCAQHRPRALAEEAGVPRRLRRPGVDVVGVAPRHVDVGALGHRPPRAPGRGAARHTPTPPPHPPPPPAAPPPASPPRPAHPPPAHHIPPSRPSSQLHVFARGMDGAIWHKPQHRAPNGSRWWNDWASIGGDTRLYTC